MLDLFKGVKKLISLSCTLSLSLLHAKGTTKKTLSLPEFSLSTKCVPNNQKNKKKEKRFAFNSVKHFGVRVFCEQLLLEGLEVRPHFRSPRCRILPFDQPHHTQARAALDQDVERGTDMYVVLGENEGIERLQLGDKRRDGTEAAAGQVDDSQRLHPRELRRERLVLGRVT